MIDPQFQPRILDAVEFFYDDQLSDRDIGEMRARAHQRAAFAAKEKARKARMMKQGSSASIEDEEGGDKQKEDAFKKDVTTDH